MRLSRASRDREKSRPLSECPYATDRPVSPFVAATMSAGADRAPGRPLPDVVFVALPGLIREHKGFAPAVSADLAGDHLAVFRRFEQRAHSAAINVLWRVLIFGLLPRHFF